MGPLSYLARDEIQISMISIQQESFKLSPRMIWEDFLFKLWSGGGIAPRYLYQIVGQKKVRAEGAISLI